MIDTSAHLLFSYGTLRQPEVQRSLFGREVPGTPTLLPGHRLSTVEITDLPTLSKGSGVVVRTRVVKPSRE